MSEKLRDYMEQKDIKGAFVYLITLAFSISIANYWQGIVSKYSAFYFKNNIIVDVVFGFGYTLLVLGIIFLIIKLSKLKVVSLILTTNGEKKV